MEQEPVAPHIRAGRISLPEKVLAANGWDDGGRHPALSVWRPPRDTFFLWSLTTLILAGLFFYDPILQGIDTIGNVFARGIGRGLTWLLLIPCFYIVFGLGRLCLIIVRKDLLKRKWSPQAETYWCDRSNVEAPPRYQEQS